MKKKAKCRKNKTIFQSLSTAGKGVVTVLKAEDSVRAMFLATVLLPAAAWWAGCSALEILIIAFVWMQVVTSEIFNSSLEQAMDYASDKEYHPIIKKGKDFAAASVFIIAGFAWGVSFFLILKRVF